MFYIGLFIVDWFGLGCVCDWLGLFVCLFGLWWLDCLWVCWFVVLVVGLLWLLCVFVWIGFVGFDFDCLGLILLVDLGLSVWVRLFICCDCCRFGGRIHLALRVIALECWV